MNPRNRILLHGILAALIALACLATYSNSLNNTFILDDYALFLRNPLAQNQNFILYNLIPNKFQEYGIGQSYYRPFAHILPAILYRFFDEKPLGYHVFNLLLFYLCCLALYVLVVRCQQPLDVAFLSSLLFATHPIHGLLVNYITAHIFALQFLFLCGGLLSFIQWKEGGHRKFYISSLVLFVLSCLCHETSFAFPFYLIATCFILFHERLTKSLWQCGGHLLTLGLILFARMKYASLQVSILEKIHHFGCNLFEYIASFTKITAWYISNLFFPHNIVLIWGTHPVRTDLLEWNALFFLFLALIGFNIFIKKNQKKFYRWALSLFCLGFTPVTLACFFQLRLGFMIEPHWLFFSSIGFFIAVALIIHDFYQKRFKVFAVIATVLVVLGFIIHSRQMNALWGNPTQYFSFWLKQVPWYQSLKFQVGILHTENKNYSLSKSYYLESLEDSVIDFQPYNNLGLIAFEEKHLDEAIDYFNKALQLNPNYGPIYNNLGIVYLQRGDLQAAENAFLRARKLTPMFLEPRYNLIRLFLRKNRLTEALDLCQENLQNVPGDTKSLQFLADLAFRVHNPEAAINAGTEILRKDTSADRLVQTGIFFAQNKQAKLAKAFFEKAIQIDKKNKDAYRNLGSLYGNLDQFTLAIQTWERGRRIYPKEAAFTELIKEAQKLKREQESFKNP